jgi:G3E family GTPase
LLVCDRELHRQQLSFADLIVLSKPDGLGLNQNTISGELDPRARFPKLELGQLIDSLSLSLIRNRKGDQGEGE